MKRTVKTVLSILSALVLLLSAIPAFAETQLIGVPDDATNLARAIKLLEAAGFITVDPAAGFTPELKDVTEYIYDIEIMPTAANTLPSTLADFAASTINGTYAVPVGLVASRDGLITEQQDINDPANPFFNIIVARTADKDNEIYKTIVDAYQTQLVAEFMIAAYTESFIPVFEYDAAAEPTITADNYKEWIGYDSPKEGKTVVKIGVCGTNNDMWYVVQKILDDNNANIYVELVEFDAYNLPNEALNSGEVDLNNFQHKAYLVKDCTANGYDLTVIGNTLTAPLTLYSNNFESIDAIKEAAGLLK